MNWIEVNDTVLRYQLRRAGGPTIVLIHEMGGTLESWDKICDALPVEVQVLRYDTRGAGLSEKIGGAVEIDDHVDDLAALLAALNINGSLALAGVAVGAAIAIRFAARQPQRVSHLIGMAPACGVAAQAREAALEHAAGIRRDGLRQIVPLLLSKAWPASLRSDAEAFRAFNQRWLSGDPQSFAAIFTMLVRLDLEDDLPRLPLRTLLVAGEYDGLRPPQEIDRLAGFATQVEALHVASGHFMPLQSPGLVTALLRQYILEDRSGAAIYRDFMAEPQHRVSASRHAA